LIDFYYDSGPSSYFTARQLCKALLSVSSCLSVCPSVTSLYNFDKNRPTMMQFSRNGSPKTSLRRSISPPRR